MTVTEDFARESARQFIKSVVYVDDEIYRDSAPQPTISADDIAPPKIRKRAGKSERLATGEVANEMNAASEEPFSLRDMAAAFAEKGIVCSLHQPTDSDDLSANSPTFRVCRSADVSVLDWDLVGDNGQKVKGLISALARSDVPGTPPSLRLLIVYTKRDNLFAVADDILRAVATGAGITLEAIPGDTPGSVRYLQYKTLRIVPFGKPGTRQTVGLDQYLVDEKSLPDRVIEEFAGFASGLLQSAVLRQIAAVRENTPKLLSRFSTDMDIPFLIHWELLHNESGSENDVGQHVVTMCTSEMEAIVSDTDITDEIALLAYCYNIPASTCTKTPCDFNTERKILLKEQDNNGKKDRNDALKNKYCQICSNREANSRFAMLMSNKTVYQPSMRKLQLGAIVYQQTGATKQYLICLQPKCDSVRLSGSTSFLFHKLSNSGKNQLIVEEDGRLNSLKFKPDVKDIETHLFNIDSSKGCLVATEDSGKWIYRSSAGKLFVWLAQLNNEHSHKISQQFAEKLSRVGLTESEWLRIINK